MQKSALITGGAVVCLLTSWLGGACPARATSCEEYFDAARALLGEKRYEEAEAVLSRGIERCPDALRLVLMRGIVRGDNLDRPLEAISDFTVVIKRDVEMEPKVLYRRGLALYSMGEYALAVKDFSRSFNYIEKYPKVNCFRAKALGKLGLFAEALNDMKVCLGAFPGNDEYLRVYSELSSFSVNY